MSATKSERDTWSLPVAITMASTVITCFPVYGMDITENDQVSVTLVALYTTSYILRICTLEYVHVVIPVPCVLVCCGHLSDQDNCPYFP